jgi:hypothetical protein
LPDGLLHAYRLPAVRWALESGVRCGNCCKQRGIALDYPQNLSKTLTAD